MTDDTQDVVGASDSNQGFLGEIRLFAGNFVPAGFAPCDGRLLSIAQHGKLYFLLGPTFGGDGRTTFGLPDLRGRVPVHRGSTIAVGAMGGVEAAQLSLSQIPTHAHNFQGSTDAATDSAPTGVVATASAFDLYTDQAAELTMARDSVGDTGDDRPHDNVQPFLCLGYIIALEGNYPSQGDEEE